MCISVSWHRRCQAIGAYGPKLFHGIVAPTDFSIRAEEAWALAQRVASTLGSEVVLVMS